MPAQQCFPQTAALGAALVVLCAGPASLPALAFGRLAPASVADPGHADYLPSLHAAIEFAFARCDPPPLTTMFSPPLEQYRDEVSSRSDVRLPLTFAPEGPVWYIREQK